MKFLFFLIIIDKKDKVRSNKHASSKNIENIKNIGIKIISVLSNL